MHQEFVKLSDLGFLSVFTLGVLLFLSTQACQERRIEENPVRGSGSSGTAFSATPERFLPEKHPEGRPFVVALIDGTVKTKPETSLELLYEALIRYGWIVPSDKPDGSPGESPASSDSFGPFADLTPAPEDYLVFPREYQFVLDPDDPRQVTEDFRTIRRNLPQIDCVIAFGIQGAELFYREDSLPVPTVIDTLGEECLACLGLLTTLEEKKGIRLFRKADALLEVIDTFYETFPFKRLGVISDPPHRVKNGEESAVLSAFSFSRGFSVEFISPGDLEQEGRGAGETRGEADVDAVFIDHYDPLKHRDFDRLNQNLLRLGLPSFAYDGHELVPRGILLGAVFPNDSIYGAEFFSLFLAALLEKSPDREPPVPYRMRFALNVGTSEALRLSLPVSLVLRADEVYRENRRYE